MEDLLSRIANMLIQSCRNHIIATDGADIRGNLWKKSPVKLCVSFQDCIRLRVAFEDHYRCVTARRRGAHPTTHVSHTPLVLA